MGSTGGVKKVFDPKELRFKSDKTIRPDHEKYGHVNNQSNQVRFLGNRLSKGKARGHRRRKNGGKPHQKITTQVHVEKTIIEKLVENLKLLIPVKLMIENGQNMPDAYAQAIKAWRGFGHCRLSDIYNNILIYISRVHGHDYLEKSPYWQNIQEFTKANRGRINANQPINSRIAIDNKEANAFRDRVNWLIKN
jgi:hypothetical protein